MGRDEQTAEAFHSLTFSPISRKSWTSGKKESARSRIGDEPGAGPDVFLINPQIPNHSQNPRINAVVTTTFPTSIGFLASYLRANGVPGVQIHDEQLYPLSDSDLEALLKWLPRPAVIGISCLTLNIYRAYELADKIKALDPEITVVLGGIHPTVLPREPFELCKSVDFVVRGEGEIAFLDLCQGILSRQSDYSQISGMTYELKGQIGNTAPAKLVDDLDTIPPFPYDMFENDLHKYPSFAGVFGSRGCPYFCTFCSARSMSGIKYRYHSVERLIHEFKVLIEKYGQDSVFLMDDNIGVHRKHFTETCDAIIKAGLHKKAFFHGSMRGDNATDELLDTAKSANFKILYFGLETGSERLMAQIDKGESVSQVADAIRRAAAKGITIGTTIIFGLPGETRQDRKNTLRFVKKLPLSSCRFNTLTPYPGTEDFRTAQMQRRLLVKGKWENFGVQYMWEGDEIPYVPPGETRLQLMWDTMYANLSYYMGLGGIKRMLTARYAGGNVIKLERFWYFKPSQIKKIWSVASLLIGRFTSVSVRLAWQKTKALFGKKPEDEQLPAFETSSAPGTIPAFDKPLKVYELEQRRRQKLRDKAESAAELAKYEAMNR
ncbi:MAG: B12-binding domain-containing radical SAM protein [Planctomycetota bacterium]|jgi:anaerobic magnesium-protoporphyrin IX monomethyl ester cyclase